MEFERNNWEILKKTMKRVSAGDQTGTGWRSSDTPCPTEHTDFMMTSSADEDLRSLPPDVPSQQEELLQADLEKNETFRPV